MVKTKKETSKETKEKKREVKKENKEKELKRKESEEKVKEKEKKKKGKEVLLVPLEDYIKAAVHLGTRAITPNMRQYVYRRKADSIAVLNTKKIDEKIEIAANFLAQYEPEQITVCCKRDAGHKALEAFGEATGTRIFTRYSAGGITNPVFEKFFEPKVLFIIDPWLDKNVLQDAVKIQIPIVALCDTNNVTSFIDVIVPCNNKSVKSIGLVLYIIAKLYLEKRGMKQQLKKLKSKDFYQFEEEEKIKKEEIRKKEKSEIREMITRVRGISKQKFLSR